MKSWVWVLAVADTEDQVGTCLSVYKDRPKAQIAFRDALRAYGGNRRYDIRLACVTCVDTFLQSNPQYRPLDLHLEAMPA
ncbi:MAG TPA: hypothetical protein VG815_14730 [Chloroflexota bacterium]|nr:hypothetical protein [Chloroflexota bacterium]